jgi:hypothetical protein
MMDGLFHYVMKSKIKTPFGDAQQSHGARQSHKLPSTKLFELNVQTLTLLSAGVHESGATHQLSIISLMTPMIYDIITLRRISS